MSSWIVVLAGIVQLAIAVASAAIPRVLGWREKLAKLDGLTRAVFWTYAFYIAGTNVCLGLLTAFAPHWLLAQEPLARAVAAYGAIYWGARLVVQFAVFRKHAPQGAFYAMADLALSLAVAFLTAVFAALAFGFR